MLVIVSWALLALLAALSARLIRSALKARALPDALVAAFLTGSLLGYLPLVLTRHMPDADPALMAQLSQTGFLLPGVTIAFFTRAVFRPSAAWAGALAWSLALVILGLHAWGYWLVPVVGAEEVAVGTPLFWAGVVARAVAFAWAALESCREYFAARRRRALGLADALLVNRFLLWTVWSGAAASILVVRVLGSVLGLDATRAQVPVWLSVTQMVIGLACMVGIWLTFAAPAFYRRWLAGPSPA